jgi:hypothetical protein
VDSWKVKVGAIAGLLCAAGVMIAFPSHDGGGPSYDYEDLSPDCQHVDTALRAWGRVIPDIQQTMASGVGTTGFGTPPIPGVFATATAKAAADVRTQARLVESASLREDLADMASGLDLVSRSRANVTDHAALPSTDFFRGNDMSMSAAHDLVTACPGVGDPPVPGMPTRAPS